MRALLVNPDLPDTYWSLRHTLPITRRRWLVPPLGLLTVAALLPRHWELRLVDLCFETLGDEDLRTVDVVLLTGMLVQRRSLQEVLARCRGAGVRTVAGGPYATALPEQLPDADHLVIGEAEEIVPELAADLEAGRARRIYREVRKPDLTASPVPRYDLLQPRAYQYAAVQFSRGCPFLCEFCDVTTLYGRRPRAKSPRQVIAELEAVRATGFRGRVMFVDDNLIGSRPRARELLSELATWRDRTAPPFDFFSECSLDLAEDPALVRALTRAGFAAIFIGVETPSEESLRETRKLQNLRGDPVAQIRALRRAGLDVWAGFILGFDHDGPDVFDRMADFILRAGIPYAMVGMLTALPGTPLHARLRREGRLRADAETGDMFAPTNIETVLPGAALIAGYARLLEHLYDPDAYFERCREHLRHFDPEAATALPSAPADWLVAARSLWTLGVRAGSRAAFWRFLAWAARRDPRLLPLAVAQACAGRHFITYTRETALPRLRAALAQRAA